MKKRVISIMLALVLLIGAAPSVFAAGTAFTDVATGVWYEEAVNWAVEKGITSGVGEGLFAPETTCTRAQVVTFLWRSQGNPEPAAGKNPFDDVSEDDYFYKAVLWAVENGITAGVLPTRFGPHSPCTRAQVATFLWRSKGESEPAGGSNPFADVSEDDYFYKAVLWAVENGVTSGTSDSTFSPDSPCTRAQIVTFLYRADAVDEDEEDDGHIWMPSGVKYTGKLEGDEETVELFDLIYEYDEAGRIIGAYTNIGTAVLAIEYGPNGRPAAAVAKAPEMEEAYEWAYDAQGNVAAKFRHGVIQEGYYCEYDAEGRLVREDYLEGSIGCTRKYTYAGTGLLASQEYHEAGSHINTEFYSYDSAGRLIKIETKGVFSPDYNKLVEYIYSEDGLTVTKKALINSINFVAEDCYSITTNYDTEGRKLSEKKIVYYYSGGEIPVEPFTKELRCETMYYSYDAQGRLVSEKQVLSQDVYASPEPFYSETAVVKEIVYTYGEGELPISIRNSTDTYDYNENAGTVFVEDMSATEEFYTYNSNGEVLKLLSKSFRTTLNDDGEKTYTQYVESVESREFDSEGRMVKCVKSVDDLDPTDSDYIHEDTWVYDAEGRLVEEVSDQGVNYFRNTWVYDSEGRLTQERAFSSYQNPWQETATVNRDDIHDYTYNAAGNLTKYCFSSLGNPQRTETYTYDSKNRMTAFESDEYGAIVRGTISYDYRGLTKQMVTTDVNQGISIIMDYSYEKKPNIPMDAIAYDLVSWFETMI